MNTLDDRTVVPAAEVRSWAVRRGLPVGARGHLSVKVIDAFNRNHRRKIAVSNNPSLFDKADV